MPTKPHEGTVPAVKPIDQLPRGYHQRPIDLPHCLNYGRYPGNQPHLVGDGGRIALELH